MKRALRIKPNKNGMKRIKIGNFIIQFDATCLTGNQHLYILKDAVGLPELKASSQKPHEKPEIIKDWLISIWET